jgi:hypothetical protein
VLKACRDKGGRAWRHASVLAAALQHAPLAVAEWLEERGGLLPSCWVGPEVVEEGREKPGRWSVHTAALLSGDVDKLAWVVRRLPPAAAQALAREPIASEAAAASGSVPLLRHLVEGGQLLLEEQVLTAAVRGGSVEAAAYLKRHRCRRGSQVCEARCSER